MRLILLGQPHIQENRVFIPIEYDRNDDIKVVINNKEQIFKDTYLEVPYDAIYQTDNKLIVRLDCDIEITFTKKNVLIASFKFNYIEYSPSYNQYSILPKSWNIVSETKEISHYLTSYITGLNIYQEAEYLRYDKEEGLEAYGTKDIYKDYVKPHIKTFQNTVLITEK